jgi:hypothetical protein
MRQTPLIVMSAILVEQHSETNAGTMITSVTKLVQPLAFRRRDKSRFEVHVCLRCRLNLSNLGLSPIAPIYSAVLSKARDFIDGIFHERITTASLPSDPYSDDLVRVSNSLAFGFDGGALSFLRSAVGTH